MSLRVLLADDDALVLEALTTILKADGMEVVARCHDGLSAVAEFMKLRPDILLMDIRMPELNGIEAAAKILKDAPEARILLLTTFQDREYIAEALALGCKGYLLKQNFASINSSIRAVASGNIVFDSMVTRELSTLPQVKRDHRLNERDEELLRLVAEGLNNSEIAEKLMLSEGTVRNYISQLLDKLALRDRTQLAIYFYKRLLS